MDSPKYNRTFHLPWSPGATSDDKIAKDISTILNQPIIITEKMDGSNTSLEANGCYARTHAAPPNHPSFNALKALHAQIKTQIDEGIQIFGEWCYALHSIAYSELPGFFLSFAVRDLKNESWLSWEDVELWSEEISVPTVPVLYKGTVTSENELRNITESLMNFDSKCGGQREGVVVRLQSQFNNNDFSSSVMKYVRANHVQSSDHWKTQEIVKNKIKL